MNHAQFILLLVHITFIVHTYYLTRSSKLYDINVNEVRLIGEGFYLLIFFFKWLTNFIQTLQRGGICTVVCEVKDMKSNDKKNKKKKETKRLKVNT